MPAQSLRVPQAIAELDLAVAQHIGIRRATGTILGKEISEHTVAVLRGEVHRVQLDAELRGDPSRILEIFRRRAVALLVVVPVVHEQRLHVVAGPPQQQCRDGGIDATRQARR